MSFAVGLLDGLAGGMTRQAERKRRNRELSILENQPRPDPGATGSTGSAPAGGSDTSAPAFTYDGAISDRPKYAFDRFVKAGIPPHVAAGLVGNLMQESGADINPAAVGDNGNAFGSAQHNGDRMRALKGYAATAGKPVTDFDMQLDFILHEGKTSEKAAWDKIMAATTAEEAALIASKAFWRPGTPHNERRAGYAKSVYSQFGGTASQPTAAPATTGPAAGSWFNSFFSTGTPQ